MRRPIVVLHVTKMQERTGEIFTLASSVLAGMTDNPWFPSPPLALATFAEHISALGAAESAVLARTKGNAEARDARLRDVLNDLECLRVYVQHVADANRVDGPAIIEGAGMSVKGVTHHDKPVLEARQGSRAGWARLYAKAMRSRCFYDWQYSPDGVNWLSLPSTLTARIDVPGLAVGATWFFRVRRSTKTGTGDWSVPVRLVVT
jgi:hypothetical protein